MSDVAAKVMSRLTQLCVESNIRAAKLQARLREAKKRIATLEAELAYERMTPVERTEYVKAQNAAITQEGV